VVHVSLIISSSYRVGGSRPVFSKLILNNANSITTIPSDGDQLFGYYMFYFIKIILSRSIIWILYVLSHDVSNALFRHVTPDCRKFMMKWDFPDESSDCHVISDELVFEVKFVSKVCQ